MKRIVLGSIAFGMVVCGLLNLAPLQISAIQNPAPQGQGRGGAVSGAPEAGGQRQGGRGGGERPRRKVLLAWADTRNGQAQHAFTSHALAIVERLGYESGLWDTFIRTDSNIIANTAFKTDGSPA